MDLSKEEELWWSQQEKENREVDLQITPNPPITSNSPIILMPPKAFQASAPTLAPIVDRLGDQGYAPGETDDDDINVQTVTIINGQILPLYGTRTTKRTCAIKELRRPSTEVKKTTKRTCAIKELRRPSTEVKMNIPALMDLIIPVPEQ